MAVSYKDINQLTQKSSVVGTEKLPVSDTEFITPDQIAGRVTVDSALSSSSTNSVQNKVVDAEFSKAAYLGASEGEVPMEVPDTIEGITMNGGRVAVTGGVADLGTVLTEHQDISGKQDRITISSSEPTSSQGSDGDIWIVI